MIREKPAHPKSAYPTWDDLRAAVRERAERYAEETGATLSAIGKEALKDDHAVFRIIDGGNFTIRTYQRLMNWFENCLPRRARGRRAPAGEAAEPAPPS